MQLKHLYEDFNSISPEEQHVIVSKYRTRRSKEFEEDRIAYASKSTRKSKKRTPILKLSEEEKALIKKLGLTQAQLRALKSMEE